MRGLRRRLGPVAIPALAVLSAFIVGSILAAYQALLIGAFGDPAKYAAALADPTPRKLAAAVRPITETLVATTPLLFTGLAVAISFRTSVFNIGVEGQFVLGAFGATATALVLHDAGLPTVAIILLSLVVGMITGAIWGFIPGFLKARTGAHEVITTIMLNYVAAQIVLFGLRSDFLRQEGSGQPISKVLKSFAQVPFLVDLPGIRLHLGFIVALLVAVLVSWFLFRTTKGFELRAAGFSLTSARYAGMSAGGSIMLAMLIAGAIAGLGGAFQVLGTVGQMSNDISSGFGWDAIALALLGGIRPSGVVIAALLFGALRTGGALMQVKTGIPLDLLFFIQALVIMFVAAPGLVRTIYRLRAPRPEGGAPAQEGAAA